MNHTGHGYKTFTFWFPQIDPSIKPAQQCKIYINIRLQYMLQFKQHVCNNFHLNFCAFLFCPHKCSAYLSDYSRSAQLRRRCEVLSVGLRVSLCWTAGSAQHCFVFPQIASHESQLVGATIMQKRKKETLSCGNNSVLFSPFERFTIHWLHFPVYSDRQGQLVEISWDHTAF